MVICFANSKHDCNIICQSQPVYNLWSYHTMYMVVTSVGSVDENLKCDQNIEMKATVYYALKSTLLWCLLAYCIFFFNTLRNKFRDCLPFSMSWAG